MWVMFVNENQTDFPFISSTSSVILEIQHAMGYGTTILRSSYALCCSKQRKIYSMCLQVPVTRKQGHASSVGIVTSLRPEGWRNLGSFPGRDAVSKRSVWLRRPPSLLSNWYSETFPRGKLAGVCMWSPSSMLRIHGAVRQFPYTSFWCDV
jgi:hypothetical protein